MTGVLALIAGPSFVQEAKPPASASPASAASSHFEQAEALAQQGKYPESITEYQRELLDNPKNEAAYFGMALAQTHLGRSSEAVQSYLEALRINPDIWEAELNLGILLVGEKDWARALFHLERAQSLNAKSFAASFYAAKATAQLGKAAEAEKMFIKALDLAQSRDEKSDVYTSLGDIYLKEKNYAKAEQTLLQARELQSHTGKADLDLVNLYRESRQYDKALAFLQTLDSAHSTDPRVYESIGKLLVENKDNVGASKAFEKAIQLETDPSRRQDLHLMLAGIYQDLGRTNEAVQQLKELLRLSSTPEIHFRIGSLYLQKHNLDGAKLEFLQALKARPDYAEAYSNLGAVFMLQEDYPDAIAALSRFKELKPEVAGTYFYLGIAYDKLDDYPKALANYGKFLELGKGQSDKLEFQARERSKVLAKKMKKR